MQLALLVNPFTKATRSPVLAGTNEKNFLALALDVTDQDAITSSIAKAQETFGRLDVVVNNAFVFIHPCTAAVLIADNYGIAATVSAANSNPFQTPRSADKWKSTSSVSST